MQYIATLWTEKGGELLQNFGPYTSEPAARAAVDRLKEWPAMRIGWWDVVQLHPDPPQNAPTVVYTPPVYYPVTGWAYHYAPVPYTVQLGAGSTVYSGVTQAITASCASTSAMFPVLRGDITLNGDD